MRNASSEWYKLKGRRHGLEKRWEQYAGFTLPRLFTDDNWNEDTDELAHDWQAVGAQAVNHLTNKVMLALFAPSRPFMRLEADAKWLAEVAGQGIDQSVVEAALSQAELDAVKAMDTIPGARAKLYLVISNLIVLGNVCMHLPKTKGEAPRIYNVAQYVVRRTGTGAVKQAVIKECLRFDELDPKVQEAVKASGEGSRYQPDTKVDHYRQIVRNDKGGYDLWQYVDKCKLPDEFHGAWPDEESLEYRFLTWNLKDGNHYGTGLVEDYRADFAGLSTLSEAQIKGAVLASEFRWLVNPSGMTKVEDFENSENGGALPGQEGDISLVANSKPGDLQVVGTVVQDYIQRIGRGFLLGSAVTRNAERVTAEEIRMQAQELETSFGGTYSSIAVGIQLPMARWLLRNVNLDVKGTKLKITIVTGLDALSRSGDLDALRAALMDLMQVGQIKQMVPELNRKAVVQAVLSGHGLPASKYLLSDEDVQAEQQAQQQAAINAQTASEAATAGVQAGIDQGQPQQ